jgi:hypothetical protein
MTGDNQSVDKIKCSLIQQITQIKNICQQFGINFTDILSCSDVQSSEVSEAMDIDFTLVNNQSCSISSDNQVSDRAERYSRREVCSIYCHSTIQKYMGSNRRQLSIG